MLVLMGRGILKYKEGITASRTPPGEGVSPARATTMGSKKRIGNMGNGVTNRLPESQKLVAGVTGRGKGKLVKELNPSVMDQRVDEPAHDQRNGGFLRNGSKREQ